MAKRPARYQTLVTAMIANRAVLDEVEVVVQQPKRSAEEVADLEETVKVSYAQMRGETGSVR